MAQSGYVADTFVAGEQPTTSKWNELWGNDASFNSGNGFNDGIIISRHLANGAVTPTALSYPCNFFVYRNASLSTNSNNTLLIPFDTAVKNVGNNVDLTTNVGRFTATTAGTYDFSAQVSVQAFSNDFVVAELYKNGVILFYGTESATGSNNGNLSSLIVAQNLDLAVGDYIDVRMAHAVAGNSGINVGSAPYSTYFAGRLVTTS